MSQWLNSKYARFIAVMWLMLALLLFNGWFLYFTFGKVSQHEAWVTHTGSVITEVDRLRSTVVDMETGQRGYLLAHEKIFLDPFVTGTSELAGRLERLRNLVADNPIQVAELAVLESIISRRVGHLKRILEADKSGTLTPALRNELMEDGRRLMRELRFQVEKMDRIEEDLLKERVEDVTRMRQLFQVVLALTTVISLLAVIIAARLIRRNQERLEIEAIERASVGRVREHLTAAAVSVAGSLSPVELAESAQNFLADRLQILSSKFFAFSNGRLQLLSAYGTDDSSNALHNVRSLVDEAVLRSGLWWVDEIPADYWHIGSSLGSARPRQLVFMPLAFQGRKLGVLEMALFRSPTREDIEVLEKASETFAVGLSAALSRQDLQELLEKTQQQAEELEAQQEELRASNEELEQQARALESQQQSLNIKNRELEETRVILEDKARDLQLSTQYKSDFLAKMSHELRTPLNGLLILSTLLVENKDKNLTEQQRQFARSIHSAGNDLLFLINDILDLSKIEARKLSLKPERFTLASLINSMHLVFEQQAKAKDVEFKVELPADANKINLNTDRQRLEQILRNFLSNSLKFTEKGFIRLSAAVKDSGNTVEISVNDSGIGIPKQKQELIFQAFEQADGTVSRKFGGTGLGLTISRELATLLGGEIHLESDEGVGSRFTLTVPTHLSGAPEGATSTIEMEKPAPPAYQRTSIHNSTFEQQATKALKNIKSGTRTILIVEDDPGFMQATKEAAEGYGFQVITADDGETAIAILDQHTPDAILLDIKLPGISGLGLLEMVKHMPHLRHIPVHMISALDYQHNTLRMGALGYLTKPVTVEKIRSALNRIETMISGRMRKILLIEDDLRQSGAINSLISGEDVEIDSVNTGRGALLKLKESTYDCVILDLTLPDISGFDMLGELNSLEISVPPIVIYTAKDLSPNEEEYLRKYSESIIIKGARSPERLLDEVNLFLHRIESLLPSEKQEMLSHLRSQKENFEGKTIMIVDDDLRNVFALTSALEAKNLNVKIAKDGVEALEMLDKFSDIDLVLMDIMMPRMDGFEAMRRIRKSDNGRIRDLPVVALTAKAMREDHERCIEAGASDYIPKPIDLGHLSTILKVWLAPKGVFA